MGNHEVIFLDAEFVDNQEIIELSIIDFSGREIYHSYYKPERIKSWKESQKIHGISPEDVAKSPSFRKSRKEIQAHIDKSRYIVGFAVKNDISHLEQSGIVFDKDKKILDVRNFFWLYYGKEKGLDYDSLPGLENSAKLLNVSFGERGAHSATEDTLVTRKLLETIHKSMSGDKEYSPFDLFNRCVEQFNEEFPGELDAYRRSKARGYIYVIEVEKGLFRLIFRHSQKEEVNGKLLMEIPVNDYVRAETDLSNKFRSIGIGKYGNLYRLKERDLRYIKKYNNEYESEISRSMAKGLMKLTEQFRR